MGCPARKYYLLYTTYIQQHRSRCKRDLAMAFILSHSLVASDDSDILKCVGEIVACSFCLEWFFPVDSGTVRYSKKERWKTSLYYAYAIIWFENFVSRKSAVLLCRIAIQSDMFSNNRSFPEMTTNMFWAVDSSVRPFVRLCRLRLPQSVRSYRRR